MTRTKTFMCSAILACLAFTSQTGVAHGKPAASHGFVELDGGVYFYQPAPTLMEKNAGVTKPYLQGFRYYGVNDRGEHVVHAINAAGGISWSAFCRTPCKAIRLSDGQRVANDQTLVLGRVFNDAAAGILVNTNPIYWRVHVPSGWPVTSRMVDGVLVADDKVATLRAELNEPVYPTASGLVVESGTVKRFGHYVKIDHGGDIFTIMGNLSAEPRLQGRIVTRDSVVGYAGCSLPCDKPAVLYQVRIAGSNVNPLPFLLPDTSNAGGADPKN
jgi:hypothetical protein